MSYMNVAYSVENDTRINTVDRLHPDPDTNRIVNLEIGPISLMLSGRTEAQTHLILTRLADHVSTLLAASTARLEKESRPSS